MDIQKENNLIQEAFEVEAFEVGFCLDQKWGDYENPYENSDTALAFNLFKKGWQAKAQAVPEGYAVVPVEPKQETIKQMSKVWFESNCAHIMKTKTAELLYKAMIESQQASSTSGCPDEP